MKKRKTIIVIASVLALAFALCSVSAFAADNRCGTNASYTLTNGKLEISGTGSINPAYFSNRKDITTVVINEGITEIQAGVFAGSSIKEVSIPKSVQTIGTFAFGECPQLGKVSFAGMPGSIHNEAFQNVSASVYVTDGWNEKNMLQYSGTLYYYGGWRPAGENTTFSVAADGTMTVKGTGLVERHRLENGMPITTKLIVEEGITELEDSAFYNFDALKEISLPSTLQSGLRAFFDCDSLTDVHIAEGLPVIRQAMFGNCYSLKTITLPNSVKTLETNAFQECHALEGVTLSENLETIGLGAFAGCGKLKSMEIPESVKTIRKFAFSRTEAMKSITFKSVLPPEFETDALSGTFFDKIYIPAESGVLYEEATGLDRSKFAATFTAEVPKTDAGYTVNNEAQFCAFINSIVGGKNYSGEKVSLKADLDLADVDYNLVWPDAKFDAAAFCGSFFGENHTIKNFTLVTTEHRGALFRTVTGGAGFSDLKFENVNISGSGVRNGFAALIGYGSGTVNVSNITVSSGSVQGYNYAGGIVGEFSGDKTITISNCTNRAEILSDHNDAGGIIGHAAKTKTVIQACENSGKITAKTGQAGGIAGYIGDKDKDQKHIVTNCRNTGEIIAEADNAGGIIGSLRSDNKFHQVNDNTNSAAVTGKTCAGGIIGFMYGGGEVERNTNSGAVNGLTANAGGIVGQVEDDACTYAKCVNTGSLRSPKNIGEICGWDGHKKGRVDLAGSSFGSGDLVLVGSLAAVLAAAVIIVVICQKKKKKNAA